MATTAQLNVRIGADIKALEKGLKDAERAIRGASARLSAAGNALSMSLTLPMLAFGAASIKAAGDIEALNKAMQATFLGAGRSVEAANKELEALRKAAEAPGLDFEQAVKASLRLQGVGFSAEKARETIIQLANAISTTGGTAENLNGVTVQMAQMISKGTILASDLQIMKENMPGLAKLMTETFGTTQADRLRELGVNGQVFVEKITAAMAKLPRVEGGISNAIVNAGVAIKMFLASVGESLNKTFNITGKLEAFATALSSIAKKFSEMSDGTRNAIAGIAVFALTIGPLLKAMSLLITAGGAVYSGFIRLQIAFKAMEAGGLIGWWTRLNAVMKLNIIGATIAVVIAAAAAFAVLSEDMSASAVAARNMEESNRKATEAIIPQKEEVELLTRALNNENLTSEGKVSILNELKRISPEYYGHLDAAKSSVEEISAATATYSEELLRQSKIKVFTARFDEITAMRTKLGETAEPSFWQSITNGILSLGNGADYAGRQIKTGAQNIREQDKALADEQKTLSDFLESNVVAIANQKKFAVAVNTTNDSVDAQAKAFAALDKQTKLMQRKESLSAAKKFKEGGDSPIIPTLNLIPDKFEATNERAAKSVDSLVVKIQDKSRVMADVAKEFAEGTLSFGKAWEEVATMIEIQGTRIQNVMFAAAQGAKQYAEQGGASFRDMGKAALAGGAKVVRSYIMQGVASAVSKALQSVPFPLNLIAGGIAGAAAGVLFNKLLGALKIPAMAKGGIASGGMTLVGELGPELVNLPRGAQVTPNNKLSSMLGGGVQYNLVPSIHYDATGFRIMLEKEAKRNGRVNG